MPPIPDRPPSWSATHRKLMRSVSRLGFEMGFRRIARREPALGSFRDPGALLSMLHAPGGDPETKNALLAALVRAAQGPSRETEVAQTMLILALWPGLDAVHGRLRRYFPHDQSRLVGELLGGLAIGIRTLDLRRVNRIAATLLRNLERDMKRQFAAERALAAKLVAMTEDVAAIDPPALSALGSGLASQSPERLTTRLHGIVGADAGLVVAVVVRGDTQAEAASALGIGHYAARKRYQRALKRLRRYFDEGLSQNGSDGGVYPLKVPDRPVPDGDER